MPSTPDERLAAAIMAAANELNQQVLRALQAGLTVQLRVDEIMFIDLADPYPQVLPLISRRLYPEPPDAGREDPAP